MENFEAFRTNFLSQDYQNLGATQSLSRKSSSSPSLNNSFATEREDKNLAVRSQKIYDISSSDDDIDVCTQVGPDSGVDDLTSSCSTDKQTLSWCASQSSVSSQKHDKKAEREAKLYERERKRLMKQHDQELKQREREEKKRQREECNRIKLNEKQLKKEQAFKRNQMKPGECLKYMTIVVDEKLFRTVLCSKAVEIFPYPVVKFHSKRQPVENSITWTRTQLDGSSTEEEDWVAVMWTGEEVAEAITDSNLVSKFKYISESVFPGKTVILLIFSMDLYHRKSQNSRSYLAKREALGKNDDPVLLSQAGSKKQYLTREEIELGLVELQILAGVCHRYFEDSAEFVDILGQFTKAIAEIPFKKGRDEVDKEMGWYARSFNKNCVRANKDMQGLDKLWLQNLTVFNNTNVDTAKAISTLYPTPTALIEAYENCCSVRERELLLQNVQVKRSGSTSAAIRRIGPELSRKICLTFMQMDGDVKLSSKR